MQSVTADRPEIFRGNETIKLIKFPGMPTVAVGTTLGSPRVPSRIQVLSREGGFF